MSRYKKTLGAMLAKHENQFYILKNKELYNVNEIGARIFDLCNGTYDDDEISSKISKLYNVSQADILKDIEEHLLQLTKMDLILEVKQE